jgi:hypothetical protein
VILFARAALCAAPALLVFAGSFLIADRANRPSRNGSDRGPGGSTQETVVAVSPEDEERLHRLAIKQETAIDLLEGRLTLDQAVTRFMEVSCDSPEQMQFVQLHDSESSERERYLMQVLAHARSHANHARGRYAEVLNRIEEEANARSGAASETR